MAANQHRRYAIGAVALIIAVAGAGLFFWFTRDRDVIAAKDVVDASRADLQSAASAPSEPATTDNSPQTLVSQAKTGTVNVRWEHLTGAITSSPYTSVPPPSDSDAATAATFSVVDGLLPLGRPNPVHCLNDGKMPASSDDPDANFRFRIGTAEGRVSVAFDKPIRISQINSYSWHVGTRAPQLYSVYGSIGEAAGFDPAPKLGIDPGGCGWTKIADVDTRSSDQKPGGRYGVSITDDSGTLGTYRYLLLRIFPTDPKDGGSQTFYSEIDVIQ
ncbi:MAG TPA: hypothetical protein VH370_08635 [Humisphaera sp.]|jgi:hypothetical protein|nr:hypothetical protein [Humisphaera sp.]